MIQIQSIFYSIFLLLLYPQDSLIFRSANGITMYAKDEASVGQTYVFEDKEYLIVDNVLLKEIVKTDSSFEHIITSKVTDMSLLFYKSTLKDPKIATWDVSNVTKMNWMFGFAEDINPNLTEWDTQSVVDFSDMFHGTQNFNGDISKWNTRSGKYFNGMFFSSNFNGQLNDWDMSSALNLSGMFDDAQFFNQPLDKWNTSSVEDMGGMFAEAFNFNQDISMWNVSNVKDMRNMFRNARSFNQDLSLWNVPFITEKPERFNFHSNDFPEPQWGTTPDSTNNYIKITLILIAVIIAAAFFIKRKKTVATPPEDNLKLFKEYLSKLNKNYLTKDELDQFLGNESRTLEAQKKARSTFIKEFNEAGAGEIQRIRDQEDSRSFRYEVKWKSNSSFRK